MSDYKENFAIFAIDFLAQKKVVSGDLSVSILRRDVPANNDNVQSPGKLQAW